MAADRNGTMPAPHEHIEISVTAWSETRFVVDYIARPRDLVAAGLVTASMEAKILQQRSGIQLDEHGLRFRLCPIADQQPKPKRQLWESGEPLRLQYYQASRHAVLKLPGVSALYPDGLPTHEERDESIRESLGDRVSGALSIRACVYAELIGRVVSRSRAVGRHQRLMRWSVIGDNVIAPDWSWMVGKRLAGDAS